MSRHTPGEWTISNEDNGLHLIWSDATLLIGRTCFAPASRANATIMAAAPDLLAACKRALPYLANHIGMTLDEGPGDRIACDIVEAAIARAEGRNP